MRASGAHDAAPAAAGLSLPARRTDLAPHRADGDADTAHAAERLVLVSLALAGPHVVELLARESRPPRDILARAGGTRIDAATTGAASAALDRHAGVQREVGEHRSQTHAGTRVGDTKRAVLPIQPRPARVAAVLCANTGTLHQSSMDPYSSSRIVAATLSARYPPLRRTWTSAVGGGLQHVVHAPVARVVGLGRPALHTLELGRVEPHQERDGRRQRGRQGHRRLVRRHAPRLHTPRAEHHVDIAIGQPCLHDQSTVPEIALAERLVWRRSLRATTIDLKPMGLSDLSLPPGQPAPYPGTPRRPPHGQPKGDERKPVPPKRRTAVGAEPDQRKLPERVGDIPRLELLRPGEDDDVATGLRTRARLHAERVEEAGLERHLPFVAVPEAGQREGLEFPLTWRGGPVQISSRSRSSAVITSPGRKSACSG